MGVDTIPIMERQPLFHSEVPRHRDPLTWKLALFATFCSLASLAWLFWFVVHHPIPRNHTAK